MITGCFAIVNFGSCAVKKLFKINHENTKVRKHEIRHRNELSALWADLENFDTDFTDYTV